VRSGPDYPLRFATVKWLIVVKKNELKTNVILIELKSLLHGL